MDSDNSKKQSANEQNNELNHKQEAKKSLNNYLQENVQTNGSFANHQQYDEIKIDVSQLPPGITEQQVKDSLKGISLKPIKGEIRQEYIPITRMVTEYKEEVYYEQVPRQVKKVNYSPINKNHENKQIQSNGVIKENGDYYNNNNTTTTTTQMYQQTPQANLSLNYISNKNQIKHSPKQQQVINQQVNNSGNFVYKQIPYQSNQQKYSPVTMIKPTYQINGKQSMTPIAQPTYLNSGFSNAVQYVRQPVQQVQMQQVYNGNGASAIGYLTPQSYMQAPQRYFYKNY